MHPIEALIPLVAIISIFVVLPWLGMHYGSLKRQRETLNAEDRQALIDLRALADRMESRMITLERILDAEAPGWRERA